MWLELFTHEGMKPRTVSETHRPDHCTCGIHVLSQHDFLFYVESDLFPYKLVQAFLKLGFSSLLNRYLFKPLVPRRNGHEFEQTPGAGEGQRSLAAVRGIEKSRTWLSNCIARVSGLLLTQNLLGKQWQCFSKRLMLPWTRGESTWSPGAPRPWAEASYGGEETRGRRKQCTACLLSPSGKLG